MTNRTPSSTSGTEDDEEKFAKKKEMDDDEAMMRASSSSSSSSSSSDEDDEGETQSISTPTRLQQRRVSGGGGERGGQKRRASMETNELSGVPTMNSKKKKTKKSNDEKTKQNEDEANDDTPHAAHAKRVRRAKRLCFELAAASATLKELDATYATKSKDIVNSSGPSSSSSSSLNTNDNNNNDKNDNEGGGAGGNEVIARWFEKHKEAQTKWKKLMKELVDVESELKKRANEVDLYNSGNMQVLKAEEAALLRYVQFALCRAKPTSSIGELRDSEVCKVLEKVVKTHGVRFVLSLSAVSKQFQRCVRSPLVWKSSFDLSTETGISDRNLLEILKEDDALSLCKNIRLDGCRFLTERSLMKLFKRAGNSIETLSMVNVAGVTDELLAYLADNCMNIHSLDVRGCKNLGASAALNHAWPKLRKLQLKGSRQFRGRVSWADFLVLVTILEVLHENEDNKIEKIAGFRLHEKKEENNGVVYRQDDETVTEEQRKIARDVEAEHTLSIDVERLILSTRDKIKKWRSNDVGGVAACEHAAAVQHGNPLAANVLTLMPRCGHVLCDRCELESRRHMVTHTRANGTKFYTYPCPACNLTMPSPGGFSIKLLWND